MSYFCSTTFFFQFNFEMYSNLWRNHWLSIHIRGFWILKIARIIPTLTWKIYFFLSAAARSLYVSSLRLTQQTATFAVELFTWILILFDIWTHCIYFPLFRQIQLRACTRVLLFIPAMLKRPPPPTSVNSSYRTIIVEVCVPFWFELGPGTRNIRYRSIVKLTAVLCAHFHSFFFFFFFLRSLPYTCTSSWVTCCDGMAKWRIYKGKDEWEKYKNRN